MARGHSTLVDQLKRAALLMPLNIAEAAGRTTTHDSGRFFVIARGSAMECAAVLDACLILKLCSVLRVLGVAVFDLRRRARGAFS